MKSGDSVTEDELITDHMLSVLKRKEGSLTRTAKTLGITRKTIWLRLKKLGLVKGYYRDPGKENPPQTSPPSTPAPPRPPLTPEQKQRYDPPTLL